MSADDTICANGENLMELHRKALHLLKEYNNVHFVDCEMRTGLFRRLLPHSHESLVVQPPFLCDFGFNIFGGENSFINFGCTILDAAPVHIGKSVLIGPNVSIYTSVHPIDWRERATGAEHGESITIGDHCWIGGSAVICPGITIGARCIIAAGAVVTKDVPDDCMMGGNPARLIKKLDQDVYN